eukprot:Skav213293  [mRNA]  locus=scaffold2480:214448:217238:- [translate_table: standard]
MTRLSTIRLLALRVKHNAAARALLRAGFGPAPAGTFALEGAVKPEELSGSVAGKVSIMVGNEDASKQHGGKVLFTLDGRDPFLCGQRYMGPFTVTSRMQLRAVAIRGNKRSQSVTWRRGRSRERRFFANCM